MYSYHYATDVVTSERWLTGTLSVEIFSHRAYTRCELGLEIRSESWGGGYLPLPSSHESSSQAVHHSSCVPWSRIHVEFCPLLHFVTAAACMFARQVPACKTYIRPSFSNTSLCVLSHSRSAVSGFHLKNSSYLRCRRKVLCIPALALRNHQSHSVNVRPLKSDSAGLCTQNCRGQAIVHFLSHLATVQICVKARSFVELISAKGMHHKLENAN